MMELFASCLDSDFLAIAESKVKAHLFTIAYCASMSEATALWRYTNQYIIYL